jgi:hypothetical protein
MLVVGKTILFPSLLETSATAILLATSFVSLQAAFSSSVHIKQFLDLTSAVRQRGYSHVYIDFYQNIGFANGIHAILVKTLVLPMTFVDYGSNHGFCIRILIDFYSKFNTTCFG